MGEYVIVLQVNIVRIVGRETEESYKKIRWPEVRGTRRKERKQVKGYCCRQIYVAR